MHRFIRILSFDASFICVGLIRNILLRLSPSLYRSLLHPQFASDNVVGDLLPEVALRGGREVALPVRRRCPSRPRLHVVHRHRCDRRRPLSRRRSL